MAEVARRGERSGAAGSAEFWAAAEKDLMAGIDSSRPNSARVWNHWLGGKDNYPVDQEAADAFREAFPPIVDIALHSRYFLHRAVGYLADEAGIGQFLDLGCGLPTVDNTHEVAQRAAPDARVVYADRDRLVMAHARALLTSGPHGGCGYVEADLGDPEKILAAAAATLDLNRPVAVLMVHVLGHIAEDVQAQSIIARLMEALPAGSHLVICDQTDGTAGVHPSTPPTCGLGRGAGGSRQSSSGPAEDVGAGGPVPAGLGAGGGSGWSPHAQAVGRYNQTAAEPFHLRSPARIARFFDGLTLLAPGVVSCTRWRPELALHPREVEAFGGVGR
ncbi:MAG TPA: SAM-dependent methyltransferase, partial [Streptosporangiaceae bacterium]